VLRTSSQPHGCFDEPFGLLHRNRLNIPFKAQSPPGQASALAYGSSPEIRVASTQDTNALLHHVQPPPFSWTVRASIRSLCVLSPTITRHACCTAIAAHTVSQHRTMPGGPTACKQPPCGDCLRSVSKSPRSDTPHVTQSCRGLTAGCADQPYCHSHIELKHHLIAPKCVP